MKISMMALATSALLAAAPAFAAGDEAPPFDKGPVWDFGQIKTVDGHFDDYMKWVATDWKAQQEALKKAGRIIDYKVFTVADPRQGEPDIILGTEYKNMAEFDRPVADEYAMQAKISGSIAKANEAQASRAAIRTVQGDIVMREVILK
jgi:hypothetical protein